MAKKKQIFRTNLLFDVYINNRREVLLLNYTLYTVMPGNTLWGIANFFGTTVDEIVRVNDIDNPEFIIPGLVLKIPAKIPPDMPSVYIVRPGDTVWGIARRYGINANDIISYNNLNNPNTIYPGQKLRLK